MPDSVLTPGADNSGFAADVLDERFFAAFFVTLAFFFLPFLAFFSAFLRALASLASRLASSCSASMAFRKLSTTSTVRAMRPLAGTALRSTLLLQLEHFSDLCLRAHLSLRRCVLPQAPQGT